MHFELKVSLLNLYCQEVARYKKLSQQEECAVIERMCQSDMAARQILIQSYLRLVVSRAKHPKYRHQAEVLNLIQEGNALRAHLSPPRP